MLSQASAVGRWLWRSDLTGSAEQRDGSYQHQNDKRRRNQEPYVPRHQARHLKKAYRLNITVALPFVALGVNAGLREICCQNRTSSEAESQWRKPSYRNGGNSSIGREVDFQSTPLISTSTTQDYADDKLKDCQ